MEIFRNYNIIFDNNEQAYIVPITRRDVIIQNLLELNVTVKETKQFDPSEPRIKFFLYQKYDELINEMYFSFSELVKTFKLKFKNN